MANLPRLLVALPACRALRCGQNTSVCTFVESPRGAHVDGTIFQCRLLADRVDRVGGRFVARSLFRPQIIPVDRHEDRADGNGVVDAQEADGFPATTLNLHALAVAQIKAAASSGCICTKGVVSTLLSCGNEPVLVRVCHWLAVGRW